MKKRIVLFFLLLGFFFAACASPNSKNAATQTPNSSNTVTAGTDSPGTPDNSSGTTDSTLPDTGSDSEPQPAQKDAELCRRYADAVPVVYMVKEITGQSMLRLYQSLCTDLAGSRTAVYVAAGDPMGSDDLAPALLDSIVNYVGGTIVISAASDDGSVSGTDRYAQAKEHGLTQIADVVVLDEHGSVPLSVTDGVHLQEHQVGAHFPEYDGYLVISHFASHPKTGFSGAVSSLSLGFSSAEGKRLLSSGGTDSADIPEGAHTVFLESMAEAGKSVSDALNGNLLYINVLNHFQPGGTAMKDIGILACTDPVALDQACVDFIYMAKDSEAFVEVIEAQNAEYVLEHAEEVGLGNSAYTLVTIE